MLKFKNSRQAVTSVSDNYQTAYQKALSSSEGVIRGWNKLNDDSVTEAVIGGIDSINVQIDTLEGKLKKHKSTLESLKAALATAGSAKCEGEVSCNTPAIWANIASVHITAIEAEIEVIENQIIMLREIKALLGFIKPDNMYFKED